MSVYPAQNTLSRKNRKKKKRIEKSGFTCSRCRTKKGRKAGRGGAAYPTARLQKSGNSGLFIKPVALWTDLAFSRIRAAKMRF
jgi:hypothetical protein